MRCEKIWGCRQLVFHSLRAKQAAQGRMGAQADRVLEALAQADAGAAAGVDLATEGLDGGQGRLLAGRPWPAAEGNRGAEG